MGMLVGKIRILSLAVIKKDNQILACPGFDKVKNSDFYRLIGGGVEFGENSLDALKREVQEELDVELINYRLVNVLENIFSYNGNDGHEICFIYEANFKDPANYQRQSFAILDSEEKATAEWIELNEENISKIFPRGCLKIE